MFIYKGVPSCNAAEEYYFFFYTDILDTMGFSIILSLSSNLGWEVGILAYIFG